MKKLWATLIGFGVLGAIITPPIVVYSMKILGNDKSHWYAKDMVAGAIFDLDERNKVVIFDKDTYDTVMNKVEDVLIKGIANFVNKKIDDSKKQKITIEYKDIKTLQNNIKNWFNKKDGNNEFLNNVKIVGIKDQTTVEIKKSIFGDKSVFSYFNVIPDFDSWGIAFGNFYPVLEKHENEILANANTVLKSSDNLFISNDTTVWKLQAVSLYDKGVN